MPVYSFECSYCKHIFDEFFKSWKNSGKTLCPKCANTAFKIPAIFAPKIFKQREFADGSKTPEFVRTPKQEKDWLKSQNITYDPPTTREKRHRKEERQQKTKTAMAIAFEKANQKLNQGYKIENIDKQQPKKIKKASFAI